MFEFAQFALKHTNKQYNQTIRNEKAERLPCHFRLKELTAYADKESPAKKCQEVI